MSVFPGSRWGINTQGQTVSEGSNCDCVPISGCSPILVIQ